MFQAEPETAQATASTIQLLGAGGFGAIIGWYVYYINRYRKGDVQLSDIVTLIGILGGGSILTLFPERSDLFGAYGVGLAIGFFSYFFILYGFVAASPNFTVDWFLDGRRKDPGQGWLIPEGTRQQSSAMSMDSDANRKRE